ncbi:MAG: AlpA family phage regulatory protein [Burkholderiaceae bacterium]|nr:AlpA family phage regulatory protein [Burkholderiaceae bacterium]
MVQRVGRIGEIATVKGKRGRLPNSPATIWRWVKAGTFPRPFSLSPGTTVWDLDAVDEWIRQRAEGGQP